MTERAESLFAAPPVSDAPLTQCNRCHVMDIPGLERPAPRLWDLRGRFAEYTGDAICLDVGSNIGLTAILLSLLCPHSRASTALSRRLRNLAS